MTFTLTEEIKDFPLVPTFDFLKKQANFFFSGSDSGIGLSTNLPSIHGTNPYVTSESGIEFLSSSLTDFIKLGSDALTLTYSEEDATYFASLPSPVSMRVRSSKKYESLFLFQGTDVILVNAIKNGTAAPPQDTLLDFTHQLFATDTESYYFGLANTNIDLTYNSTANGEIVITNCSPDFFANAYGTDSENPEFIHIPGTCIELFYRESIPCVTIDFNTTVTFNPGTLTTPCSALFLFSGSGVEKTVLFSSIFDPPIILLGGDIGDYEPEQQIESFENLQLNTDWIIF